MDYKKSPTRRQKRQKIEESYWDCSVCTYRNTAEAFKCLMCDVRKGTSTRKPRLNSALVAQQSATLPATSGSTPNGTLPSGHSKSSSSSSSSKLSSSSSSSSRHNNKSKHKKYPARLKNVDRSTAQTREVTVNSVTVVITEYKPKTMVNRRESSEQSFSESNDSRS
ncbi:YY1-associated factor 2 [Condylostylus longicornis]|uniref:YY1-associated factor 2 n=1 Tax=Condylostylus longicornis TaxID=2530218 RepID=UPI00244DAC6D|nr:YY1-associated factor 2 [Condylostylus longicornis]